MAVPVYANDLTTIATGDLNFDAGTWSESGDAGWDTAGSMVDDENLQYTENSTNTGEAVDSCTSQQYTKDGNSAGAGGPGTIMYTHTAPFTVPADGVVLIDDLWAAPSALNPYAGTFLTAEAGVSVLIGGDADNFDVHYVSGSNKPPAPEGGWTTYAVDPTITPAGTVGTVTNTTTVGVAIAAVAQARGNPHACQSVRYGRAEVEYTVGDSTTPTTFTGYAAIDNAPADRFNLLKIIKGGYEGRGLMTFGIATTAVYFDDSDKSIVIADDLKVSATFNKGVVNNASSVVNWTNIAITNQSAVSKYTFVVNDAAETNQTGCVFTDLGTFTYGANSTQDNVTYRRQELVTQGSSTFISCKFDSPIGTVGLAVNNLSTVTKCTFSSDGTGYAVDLGTVDVAAGDVSVSWDNLAEDYGLAQTTDAVILVNITNGGTNKLIINVADTGTSPTVNNTGTGGAGDVIVPDGGIALLNRCSSLKADFTKPTISIGTAIGTASATITGHSGGLHIIDCNQATDSVKIVTTGPVELDASCTNGQINIMGNARPIDNSGPGCTVNWYNMDAEQIKDIWQLMGLDKANPITTTQSATDVENIHMNITGDGVNTSTITRTN